MNDVKTFFSDTGPLSTVLSGYKVREQQLDLSLAIEKSMRNNSALIAEAGTGTGKTFAYLVPALQTEQKVIISTGTKNLQEQLFKRDLPLVRDLIAKGKDAALLKGRSNYLCIHRVKLNEVSNRGLEAETLQEFRVVLKWASGTKTGDMSELKQLKEDAKVLPLVTSTIDNCLGKDCSYFEECHLVKARKKALAADVLVVNHHLFFADLALKEQGFGELIPSAQSIIFDEAHLIPDIASEYFGDTFSTRQLSDQLKDLGKLQKVSLKDASQLSEFADKCIYSLSDLRMQFPADPERGNWQDAIKRPSILAQMNILSEQLNLLLAVGEANAQRDTDVDSLLEKIGQNAQGLSLFLQEKHKDVSLWYETSKYHVVLHLTPLSIAKQFQKVMDERDASWIFTSATLAIDENFEHFQKLMGLHSATTLCLDSPFDYQAQAMLCVPRYLPEPSSKQMKQALAETAITLVEAAKGRCFILFTSHRMMKEVAEIVADEIDNKILVQGERAKSAILHDYLEDASSVLFATGAFWEGVDVKGDDLLCVMIDKLPFASPDDPLFKARLDDCRKQGGMPFFDIQVPQAVIALKQGAGRLIRDVGDRGVLVICDNRLVTKPYGSTFINSLPNMKKTRSLSKVQDFLKSIQ
ncbi:ATP-dependent DNA helicase [Glaciecola sp. 2405UD65-10]|uniref:ATP-dependent DNA helicase n=1 Tax=Glaciecola sp. 2405UD65-10 TaxID=3397244 RepID=UPI003B5AF3D7